MPAAGQGGPVQQQSLRLEVTAWRDADHVDVQVDLLLAMPRPKVLRRLLPVLAELGVASVTLTAAERVEKVYFASHVLHPAQVRAELLTGLEQAGATQLPPVALARTLKGALLHARHPGLAIWGVRFLVAPEPTLLAAQLAPLQPAGAPGCGLGTDGNTAGDAMSHVDMAAAAAAAVEQAEAPGTGAAPGALPRAGPGGAEGVGEEAPLLLLAHPHEAQSLASVVRSWQRGRLLAGEQGGQLHDGGWEAGSAAASPEPAAAATAAPPVPAAAPAAAPAAPAPPPTPPPPPPVPAAAAPAPPAAAAAAATVATAGVTAAAQPEPLMDTPATPGAPQPVPPHRPAAAAALPAESVQGLQGSPGGRGRVVIAVGPEGGWREAELGLLQEAGFVAVSLGPRTLATTTATVALVSVVQELARRE